MSDSDHKMPESVCPNCRHKMDGAYNAFGEDAPRPGDISICIQCASILAFDEGLQLRFANDAELKEIAGNSEFKKALGAVSQMTAHHD